MNEIVAKDGGAGPRPGLMDIVAESRRVRPAGRIYYLVGALSVIAVLLVTWLALFGIATEHLQVSLFLVLLMPVAFLTTTASRRHDRLIWLDWLFALVAVAAAAWFAINEPRYGAWMSGFDTPSAGDMIAGCALLLMAMELCRRSVGPGLSVILVALLAYVALGHLLPGSFHHEPITFPFFLELQVISQDGLFGTPLYVAASYAFLFVLFGNFYVIAGGGKLFFDVAAALTGNMIGGPAKACVVSSGLYGSISGSPVADVATTGPISIPIMRRLGIPAERAGAIEAAASTGGSMLPPVMGAVAFIMADFTGITYNNICLYALLPALGYYLGVFSLVHFEAVRLDLGRLPREEIVGLRRAIAENWPSLIPIVALIWLLVHGYTAAYVAAGAAVAVIVSSFFNPSGRIGPRRFVDACVETCYSSVPLVAAVAAAGIIIGCIELTGLSGKFTLLLFDLSGGYLVPSLILAGFILILLGMGMPTTAVYIMGVALLAPVLTGKFGLPLMPVHMFLLFYACLSAITPPVAVAAFAAAAIAEANPFRLGPYASKLAVGGFILPFFFLFNQGILMQGSWLDIATDTLFAGIMVISMALALHGHIRRDPMSPLLRIVFAAIACVLVYPHMPAQAAAAIFGGGLFYWLHRSASPAKPQLATQ